MVNIVTGSATGLEPADSRDPDDLGFLDLSSDLICICRNDRITSINRAGVRILGGSGAARLSRDDLIGRRFYDFLAADYADAVDVGMIALVDEAQPFPLKLIGLDGTEIGAEVSVFLIGASDPDAVIVFARDITRQVELSEAIHRSEQRYRSLIHHALDLICVCEGENVTFINRAGVAMLGASGPEEVVGRPLAELLHPDYRDIFTESINSLLQEDALLPLKLLRRDGKVLDVELGLASFDGRVGSRYMVEARDITPHNRHVTQLRRMIDTLEQQVEERTRELTREVAERRKAEELQRHLATHDVLTGLPNRYLLKDRLAGAVAHAHRSGGQAALMFIDLDGFKPVNDTLGHDAGDILLKGVAQRLQDRLRETDTAARVGGDEFVLVLADVAGRAGAEQVAAAVVDAVGVPFDIGGRPVKIGASIGIALYPDHGTDPDALMKSADTAMYAAKGAGKNTWSFAPSIA